MEKTIRTVAAAILLLAITAAAEERGPGVIHWQEERTGGRVEITGKVVEFEELDNLRDTPESSFAARVAWRNTRFEWTPTVDHARSTGGAMLLDAAIAPDRSAVIVLERLGRRDGPFGSRLVVFNLRNDAIVRCVAFTDRMIAALAVIPDSSCLWLLQRAQKALNTEEKLLLYDLAAGEILAESPPLGGEVKSCQVARAGIFVQVAGYDGVLRLDPEAIDAPPKRFAFRGPAGFVRVDEAGRYAVNVADGAAELYLLAGDVASRERRVVLPRNFEPDFGLLLDLDRPVPVLGEAGGRTVVVWGDSCKTIAERSGRLAVWHAPSRQLLLHLAANNTLARYPLPGDFTAAGEIVSTRLKPVTRGDFLRFFPDQELASLLVVDTRSNIFRLDQRKKRWQKHLVFHGDEALKQ